MVNMLFKLYNHVCVSILQLCAWGGAGTPQGYIKHMVNYHSNSKSPQLLLVSVLLHHLHLLLCAVQDFEMIGPAEFEGKMLQNTE